MRRAYARSVARFILFGTAVSGSLYLTASRLSTLAHDRSDALLWALAGGLLLVIGLWNTNLLFRLSLPVDIAAAIARAVAADLLIGYLLSRIGSYHYAVAGFGTGTCCFAALTTRSLLRRLKALDYYCVSSSL